MRQGSHAVAKDLPEAGSAQIRVTCPICRQAADHDRYVAREMMFGTREAFPYLRCGACGTLRIEAVPSDLGRHYPPAYHYSRLPEDMVPGSRIDRSLVRLAVTPDVTGHGRTVARLARRVAPVPPGYRRWRTTIRRWGVRSFDGGVLDVGAGTEPARLVVLRALGFRNLLGIDPFVEHDVEVAGVRVRKARLDEVRGPFDLVMFHHSLEHVPDPQEALAAAVRLLRPRGRVLVRLPVMGSALWDRYGVNWWELDAPRHLYLLTPAALVSIAAAVGLRLVESAGETTAKEFIGSAQYERDLAMFEAGSWFVDPDRCALAAQTIRGFEAAATRANDEGRAGRRRFLFERS